jgi:hypothetical protein
LACTVSSPPPSPRSSHSGSGTERRSSGENICFPCYFL